MFIETVQIHDPSSVRSDMWRIMADVHLHMLCSEVAMHMPLLRSLLACRIVFTYKHATPNGVHICPESIRLEPFI